MKLKQAALHQGRTQGKRRKRAVERSDLHAEREEISFGKR